MATVKSTLALEDRMSKTLTSVDKAAMQNIQTFNNMAREVDNLKRTLDEAERINPNIVKTQQYAQASMALEKMENKLYDVANGQKKLGDESNTASENIINNNKRVHLSFTEVNQGIELAKKGLDLFGKIADISDTYVQSTARLNLMNDGLQTTEKLQNKIFASANRIGAKYQAMADNISKLGMQAGNAFKSNDEIIAFSENLNKLFTTSGLDTSAIESTMYNLTQSLSSGKLLGQDYRILKQNAPQMIKYLEDFYGVNRSTLDKMVSDGQITAQGLKSAIFKATDDINEKFDQMPMTWGRVWSKIQNTALKASQPILNVINNIANNWDKIQPIIMGVAIAIGIYTGALLILNTVQAIHNGLEAISAVRSAMKTGATLSEAAATTTATGAQAGFNAALLACPLTWIVLAIIAVVVAIYMLVNAWNEATDSTVSATGIILGLVYMLAANFYNTLIVPIWNGLAILVNFLANCFKDPVQSVKILFMEMAHNCLNTIANLVKGIEALINKIPGVQIDITGGISSLVNDLEGKISQAKDKMGWEDVMGKLSTWNPDEAYNQGYKKGSEIESKIGETFNDLGNAFNKFDNVIGNDGTGGKALKTTSNDKLLDEEDVQLLLDVATRDYKLNYQQVTPEIVITFGDVKETADVDEVLDEVADRLQEIYDGSLVTT